MRAEAVDDLAQDALLVAHERLDTFRREDDFGAWVRGIARRLVANALRKENRRQQILSDHVTELLAATTPEDLHPLAETAQEDRLTALHLPGKTPRAGKQLLHLRYFEEASPGLIASRMERSATDVRQQLFRFRRALLKCVERQLTPSRGMNPQLEAALIRLLDGEPEPGDGELPRPGDARKRRPPPRGRGLLAVDDLLAKTPSCRNTISPTRWRNASPTAPMKVSPSACRPPCRTSQDST